MFGRQESQCLRPFPLLRGRSLVAAGVLSMADEGSMTKSSYVTVLLRAVLAGEVLGFGDVNDVNGSLGGA